VNAPDVRPGDKVRLTVPRTIGPAYVIEDVVQGPDFHDRLWVGGGYRIDAPGRTVEVLERAAPVEPGDLTVWVVDCDDSVWQRRGRQWHHLQSGELQPWIDLHNTYGPLRPLTAGDPL
jgi:hypothetical protein